MKQNIIFLVVECVLRFTGNVITLVNLISWALKNVFLEKLIFPPNNIFKVLKPTQENLLRFLRK